VNAPRFVHLRLHSEYSVTDGIVRIEEAVAKAAAYSMPALALTDSANVFGMVKFYKAARAAGIKPIVGADCWIRNDADREKPARLLLLCASTAGYRKLSELLSRAWLKNQYRGRAEIARSWFDEAGTDGLIALSGAGAGEVGQALASGNDGVAARLAADWAERFPGRFYLEVQRAGFANSEPLVTRTLGLAGKARLPVVATHPVQFLAAEDFRAHEARVCIAEGNALGDRRRPKLFTPEQYLKSSQEMARLFADVPQAIENACEIARRCNLEIDLGRNRLPEFPTPAGVTVDQHLAAEAARGLEGRLERLFRDPAAREREAPRYRERLAFEINTIVQMGFAGYFLIVADFISWARAHRDAQFPNGIPVGPGRGSGAGSLVAYSLGITDLDPLRYDLLFERFLNPERVSMPDFDIDFCQDGRDKVIDYVRIKYGEECVSQIATFGTMAARAVIRDTGRVLELGYNFCDQIAKLVPFHPGRTITLKDAREMEPLLAERERKEDEVRELLELGETLEGLTRSVGMHAGGVLIAPGKLTDFCPLYAAEGTSNVISQLDKDDVEAIGLVKFDFLGLTTLTVLDWAERYVRELGEADFALERIPLDDAATYKLIAAGNTSAVFQLESRGMRDMVKRARPDRFEDIIALVALYRPGPMANIPTYCARKHGMEQPDYIHLKLEPILRETFGVIIYQEQVMQAAQILAGFTLGEADLLRRAMGKKIRKEMQAQRERFVSGAVERGVERNQADAIFDLLERFAEYGFNKSHAAAYALVAYQTAYMKANFPVEFLAATMTLDMGNTDKLAEFRAESERLGIAVDPPSINRSAVEFEVDGNTIIYALAALKGVGRQAVEAIMAARENGSFGDLADFAGRVNPRAVNKRVLESLAAAGAFDAFEKNRARVFAAVDAVLGRAQRSHDTAAIGQSELFGGGPVREQIALPQIEPWLPAERLRREYEAVGFFLSGHPLDDYAAVLKKLRVQPWAEFSRAVKAGATAGRVAATVVARTERRTRTGSKMGIIGLSDPTGHFEAVIFSEGLAEHRDLLEPGNAVLLFLSAEVQGDEVRARIQSAEPLDNAAANLQKGLRVFLRDEKPLDAVVKRLEAAPRSVKPNGDGEVSVVLLLQQGTEVEVKLPGRFKVSPQIAGAIKAVPGVVQVEAL